MGIGARRDGSVVDGMRLPGEHPLAFDQAVKIFDRRYVIVRRYFSIVRRRKRDWNETLKWYDMTDFPADAAEGIS